MISFASRKRRWIYAPLLFGFFGSSCTHGALIVALLLGIRGQAGGSGENGLGGSGGGETTIDVSYPGSTPFPVTPGAVTTAPPPPTNTKEKTEEKIHEKIEEKTQPESDVAERVALPEKQAIPSTASSAANGTGSSGVTGGGRSQGPTRVGFPNLSGVDGSTVDGQRALLPAAATCADPVAGRWEALKFSPLLSAWVHFTLAVHRYEGGALTGTILSRTWSGSAFDRAPPACSIEGFDFTVSMNASGNVDTRGRITFGSSRFSLVSVQCPSILRTDYAPDTFTGVVDSSREEFQSLNNDGANNVNEPYVFRHTGCL